MIELAFYINILICAITNDQMVNTIGFILVLLSCLIYGACAYALSE
jgi:hypothetical protein